MLMDKHIRSRLAYLVLVFPTWDRTQVKARFKRRFTLDNTCVL